MRIDRTYQLEAATAKDVSRPVLCHIWVERDAQDPTRGRAMAADGYICAVVPVTLDEEDVPGFVPVAALVAARKACPKYQDPTLVLDADTVRVPLAGQTFKRETEGTFPNLDRVIPARPGSDAPTINRLKLDASLLVRATKAIGAEYPIMYFTNAFSGIRVESPSNTDVVAVVMPRG